jgi:2'-5' RNA ligase
MKEPTYTVTINFFVPDDVVEKLKQVKISGPVLFDWRKPHSAHCTVNAVYHGVGIPDQKVLDEWAEAARPILAQQEPFEVEVEGITYWPTALVSNVHSEKLKQLHRKLFQILPSIQPHFDGENYHPHVSFAKIGGEIKVMAPPSTVFGRFQVSEIQLMLWGLKDLKKATIL